jgi:glycerol-3-phosphate dehydrogenase
MVRDVRALADTRFDLVVVGAGFYGAVAAWDAVLRGLSVALIDKGDFGSGTSFNNLKTLHGGLRSLQALDFGQMRLFIRERRALARVAPHLVHPLPFVVPTYLDPRRSALLMKLALTINDIVARDRHEGLLDPSLHLPNGYLVSRDECLQLNPTIDPAGVRGGAVWHDYQMHNTDRMTFAFVASAADAGACAANYVQAKTFLREGSRVIGVRAEDRLSGTPFDLRGSIVLNAAGPWASSLLDSLERGLASPAPKLSRAINLVTRRVTGTHACGGLAGGRFLFLVPWRNVSVLGTSHDTHDGTADTLKVTRWDVEAFLKDARKAFPHALLKSSDVRLVHRGLLPMLSGHETHVKLLRESTVVDHRRDDTPGLVSMFGVRYTTARATAEAAIDAVFRARGVDKAPPCRTASTPVAGGNIESKDSFLKAATTPDVPGLTSDSLRRIALTYGNKYGAVLQISRDRSALAGPLGRACNVSGAELAYAVREESAKTLTDALIRRTEAGSAGHPGADAVARAADIVAEELGWDGARKQREIAAVERFYKLSN